MAPARNGRRRPAAWTWARAAAALALPAAAALAAVPAAALAAVPAAAPGALPAPAPGASAAASPPPELPAGPLPRPEPGTVPAECGAELDARHRLRIEAGLQRLVFAPQPAPIGVGRHFGLDIAICPRPGASMPVALQLDAVMPAHRHGMNYRPTLRRLGPGRWRAEGLLFHMPGRWRFVFDLSADGHIERLQHEVEIR